MMFKVNLLVLVLLHSYKFGNALDKPSNLPCKLDDEGCITGVIQWLYDSAISGDSEKGIENLDPMYLEVIEGNQGYANYTLKQSTLEGYKMCKITNASFKADFSRLHMGVFCPRYHMTGQYSIEGSLINYPIRGIGDFFITTTKYNLTIDLEVEINKIENDLFAKLKTFKAEADLMGTADFELKNLFDGNKELSDPIHKFGKENPKLFASFLDKPIFKVAVKKLMKNYNSLLKEIPITELLQVNESGLKIKQ